MEKYFREVISIFSRPVRRVQVGERSPHFYVDTFGGRNSQTLTFNVQGLLHACRRSDNHDGSQSPHTMRHVPGHTSHVDADTAKLDTRYRGDCRGTVALQERLESPSLDSDGDF